MINYAFPQELREMNDIDKFVQDNTSYIPARLAESFSDVVWRTTQKGSK